MENILGFCEHMGRAYFAGRGGTAGQIIKVNDEKPLWEGTEDEIAMPLD